MFLNLTKKYLQNFLKAGSLKNVLKSLTVWLDLRKGSKLFLKSPFGEVTIKYVCLLVQPRLTAHPIPYQSNQKLAVLNNYTKIYKLLGSCMQGLKPI